MTDFPDWTAPQANATAISTTGVPLLRQTITLGSGSGVALSPGLGATLLNRVTINQPSFEGLFSLSQAAGAGSNPFAVMFFNWFDSASGLNVASRSYVLSSGNGPANQLQYYVSGPCFGDQLSVSITNLESLTNQSLTYAINSTSHLHARDTIYQPVYAQTAPITFSSPNGNPLAGVLFRTNPSVPANSTLTRLIAVYNAVVDIMVDANGSPANVVTSATDPSGQLTAVVGGELFAHTTLSGGRDQFEVGFPNGPVLLNIRNTSTNAAFSPQITGVIRPY